MNYRIAAALLAVLLPALFSTRAHADPAADKLIKQVVAATMAVKSATGEVSWSANGAVTELSASMDVTGKFRIMRPNMMREDDWMVTPSGQSSGRRSGARHYIAASDGTTYWLMAPDGSMSSGKADAAGSQLANATYPSGGFGPIATMFFDPTAMDFGKGSTMTVGQNARWEGAVYRVIRAAIPGTAGGGSGSGEIFIGSDGLIHRIVMDAGSDGHLDLAIRNLRTGVRFAKTGFRFRPPDYAKLVTTPTAAISSPAAPGVTLDPAAKRIFASVDARMRSIRTLTADFTDTLYISSLAKTGRRWTNFYHFGSVKLMRPNFARMETGEVYSRSSSKTVERETPGIVASDGKTFYHLWDPIGKFYESSPVKPDGSNIELYECDLLRGSFFTGKPFESDIEGYDRGHAFYAGPCVWRGDPYERIEARLFYSGGGNQSEAFSSVETLLVGRDGLVHEEYSLTRFEKGTVLREDRVLTNVVIDPPLSKSDFTYTLPAGSTEQVEFPMPSAQSTPALLANGVQAPDFTVYDPQGKPVKLSDYAGKVVVLDFWATWCGPCQDSLPRTNALAGKLAGQNVQFLAVNVWDTQGAFNSWLPAHKQLGSLSFAIDTTPGQGKDIATTLYHVSGIPTQFVIDPGGKIVQSFVGDDPTTNGLAAAIKTAEQTKG